MVLEGINYFPHFFFTHVEPKGTTINDLGGAGGGGNREKKISGLFSRKNKILVGHSLRKKKNVKGTLQEKKIMEGVPGENILFRKFLRPPPQIINSRPLTELILIQIFGVRTDPEAAQTLVIGISDLIEQAQTF